MIQRSRFAMPSGKPSMPMPNDWPSHQQNLRLSRARLWFLRNKPLSYWVVLAVLLLAYDATRCLRWTVGYLHSQRAPPPPQPEPERKPVDPLINFQILNSSPVMQHYPTTTKDERAVVTTMYTDAFAHGVATLGHSLQSVNTTARLILAYFPKKISPRALCVARAGGWELQPIERIAPPHNGDQIHSSFIDQYSKLNLWSFDNLGIKSIVYLDGDTLVRNNFDELFDLPYQFAAGPDVWTDDRGFVIGFNAGVMLLRPSTPIFHDLVAKMETADYPLQWAEQAYLNLYFGAHALRLPFIYNGNVAIKERSPVMWKGMEKEMRVVHYTLAKPFPSYVGGMIEAEMLHDHLQHEKESNWRYSQELGWWEKSWNAMRAVRREHLGQCDVDHPPPPLTRTS